MIGEKSALNIQEQIARIERELATITHLRQDDARLRLEISYEPRKFWLRVIGIVVTGLGAGAAVFAAGAAFMKLLG